MLQNRLRDLACIALIAAAGAATSAQDFPPFDRVSEGYERVVSTVDGLASFYTVYHRAHDGQLLAELPGDFESQRFFVVATVAGGDPQLGVYSVWHNRVNNPTKYLYWKRYGRELALMEPNLAFRASGDRQSQVATERVNTDRVLLSVPIVSMGPGGGPVIDLDHLLLNQSTTFFGNFTRGARLALAEVKSAKAFPRNIELTFELPKADGQLAQIHYSIGVPQKDPGYKIRLADRRVGFFYVSYTDRSRNDGESQTKRYITRWHIEKADPKLSMSPPRQPIVYYIEHTTPVRYRRWVREGILAWNKAFEQAGIINAIEVYQQDAETGAHMDKDPEDLRYSFVRWTNSHMGFAIGPSHAHPETGQIFEADIVMDEAFLAGWARAHRSSLLASAAMLNMLPETVDWLADHPQWDPRYLMADPEDRAMVLSYVARQRDGIADQEQAPPTMLPGVWHDPRDPQFSGMCMSTPMMATNIEMMRLAINTGLVKFKAEEKESLLDGLPESFIGPLLRDVIMHEVGHTLGLMHNWKGSSVYSFAEINSEEFKGTRPILTSVMDYSPTNIVVEGDGLIQGDYSAIDIGPYDHWAIAWGYSDNPDEVMKLCTHPEHAFTSDEGSSGPDPHAKVWDLGENSLDFADAEIRFVRKVRAEMLDTMVEDGDSWVKAREGFNALLQKQLSAMSIASSWIGGVHFNRYHKGDEGAADPVRPVDVERQRRALRFIAENAFMDKSFGLTPEILSKLGALQWFDGPGSDRRADVPVHDMVLGVQGSAMTMILNPSTLGRVLDNELRTPLGQDALTVPEIFSEIRGHVWKSLSPSGGNGEVRTSYTARDPMITSLQRNLQRAYLDRMIVLSTGASWPNASGNAVTTLARQELRDIGATIDKALATNGIDEYSKAHLVDARERISRALDAAYIRRD